MNPPPASMLRVVWALFKVASRRWRNRFLGRLFARRGRPGEVGRQPTPRKGRKWTALGAVMAALMLLGAGSWYISLVGKVARELDVPVQPGKLAVNQATYDRLKLAEDRLAAAEATGAESRPAEAERLRKLRENVVRTESSQFWIEAMLSSRKRDDANQAQERLKEVYLKRGLAGFQPRRRKDVDFLLGRHVWKEPARRAVAVRSLGLVLTGLLLMLLFKAFGAANLELKSAEWSVAWLLTFPVAPRGVFLARLVHVGVMNAFSWFFTFPFFAVVFFSAGRGLWSLPMAVVMTLGINFVLAAVQVTGETYLRQRLGRGQLNNVVGLCTILQMIFLMGTMAAAMAPDATAWLVDTARRLPEAVVYVPTFLPLQCCRGGSAAWAVAAGLAGLAVAAPVLAALACERMVAGGVLARSGTFEGRRARPAAAGRRKPHLLRGVLGKELLLLARDRSFLAQTVILPIILCLFQVVINRHLVQAAASAFRHAAALAFGTGAYVMLTSGAMLLVSEIRSLWLLYTLPHRLDRLLIRKIALWSVIGVIFSTAILAVAARNQWQWSLENVINACIALVGVAVVGCVSAGIAVLATDVAADRPRVAGMAVVFNMFLAGVFLSAIYATSLWHKAVIVALFILVACAVWQKVRDRIGYLLDPAQMPPPELSLSDGLIAAFAFFGVQSLLFAIFMKLPLEVGDLLALTYTAAGLVIAPASLLIFWRRKIPHVLSRLGLRRTRGDTAQPSWAGAALRGLAWGLAAGAAGSLYLLATEQVRFLRKLKEQTPVFDLARSDHPLWLLGVALVVGPLLEEFLFRGLLFQGLKRSVRPALAVVASAVLFAIVHPPIAVLPVFGLGVAAAMSFRSTRLLIAPVTAHVTYNAAVMAAGYLIVILR